MITIGELKHFKIGELAELAGVSKRTIDYYTNLGLLKPERSETNYRYYNQESLARLRFIESLKEQRLTLDEIKARLPVQDNSGTIDIQFLKDQFKQLETQLAQLQPAMSNMDAPQVAQATRQVLVQSMAIMQSLLLYINEVAPFL